jgi:1-acyl-sn-glycerol-3-phosphate acyltransferase
LSKIASRLVEAGLDIIIRILAGSDTSALKAIPETGPLIIIFNHVNFHELPLLYLRMKPRAVNYMAKAETWDNPFLGWMADNWKTIRIYRGEHPMEAFRKAAGILEQGRILIVAPEGTRSSTGILGRGLEGTVILALERNTTIIPVGHTGAEKIHENMRKFRRTRVKLQVGRPFRLKGPSHPGKKLRKELTEAMMRELAVLLPEEQRGIYRDVPFNPDLIEYSD